jgi:hypothetical protein
MDESIKSIKVIGHPHPESKQSDDFRARDYLVG